MEYPYNGFKNDSDPERIKRLLAEIERLQKIEQRAKDLREEVGAFRVSMTDGSTDEYARMCAWEAYFDDVIPYGEGDQNG